MELTENIQELASQYSEQIVLGCIIIDHNAFYTASEILTTEDFYYSLHSKIFNAISNILNSEKVLSIGTLESILKEEEEFQKMDGLKYLSEISTIAMVTFDFQGNIEIVKDFSLKRQMVRAAKDWIYNAYKSDVTQTAIEQINTAEYELFQLMNQGGLQTNNFVPIKIPMDDVITNLDKAMHNPNFVIGISTGFLDLDKLLSGFQNSDLLILAARPSMGKTALAINFAINACVQDKKVGFFSLEMSAEQIAIRMLAVYSGIAISNLKTGYVEEGKYNLIKECSKKISEMPMFIDDSPDLTIANIRSRARKVKKQYDIDILFIDYLQLLKGSKISSNYNNRVVEVSEITQGLKAIAKELNIPVVALSQLSRAVELRSDKRPLLSDLRESGSIEQDADIVMFIYREEYYLSRGAYGGSKSEFAKDQATRLQEVKNLAEIIIAKHRNGAIGNVILSYLSKLAKFDNYDANLI